MFKERQLSFRKAYFFLIVAFFFLFLPFTILFELNDTEATYALIARDMLENENWFAPTLEGQEAWISPLPAWTIAGSMKLSPWPNHELSIRFISLLSLVLLAALCAYMSYKLFNDKQSHVVTVAALISSVAVLIYGFRAEQEMLFALLLNITWFVWYLLIQERRRWLFLWPCIHFLLFLTVLAGGMKALFLFYFPLLFLRKPFKILRRMTQINHILSFSVLILVLSLCSITLPYFFYGSALSFKTSSLLSGMPSYFKQLLWFPIQCSIAYIPWILLLWAPFCMAFKPVERNKVFAQFLRTLSLSLFLFIWFFPGGTAKDLLPLIGPLSILSSMHYAILLRRYGCQLMSLVKTWFFLIFVSAFLLIPIVSLIHYNQGPILVRLKTLMIFPSVLVLICVTSLYCFYRFDRHPLWLSLLLACSLCSLGFTSTFQIMNHQRSETQRIVALKMNNLLMEADKKMPLYLLLNKLEFPAASFYLQRPVIRLAQLQELQDQELPHHPVVYVFSDEKILISEDRDWTLIKAPLKIGMKTFRLWKGSKRR